MSTPRREELLTELRRVTADALSRARAGEADADALSELVAARETLFCELARLEGPVTSRLRALAHEITLLDRTLVAWCEQNSAASRGV